MFQRILIANRGEIACRVARSARRLGIDTVAVYSDVDVDAAHVAACDQAWPIGPAPARDSYLRGDKIIEVALASGAEAIHPGYGFLSENAGFARDCAAAGLVFIGPPADAIDAMGSKIEAKRLMQQAGVPLVPGYHGDEQSAARLAELADEVGYPLLIKASAGGGGKGMRVVDTPEAFADALDAARREAQAAFGDEEVLLERYLVAPRHVEIQLFADSHGNAVYLFERDCSIQRRLQKIVEEAPAPGIDPALRSRMGEAAVDAARAVGYVGAGTVEFLLDRDGAFYFMEMNTRLQVEHPVTEMITGQDLVEWQLRVAAGGPLPLAQSQLQIHGHAIEARIYAENPEQGFLPATGTISRLRLPVGEGRVRIDAGVREGDAVTVHYDPMIAKLIVWGDDRDSALRGIRRALSRFQLVGVQTNLNFLSRVVGLPAFAEADLNTHFLEHNQAALAIDDHSLPESVLAVAALFELLDQHAQACRRTRASDDPWSPWGDSDGWRLNQQSYHALNFAFDGVDYPVTAHFCGDGYLLELPGGERQVAGCLEPDGRLQAQIDGRQLTALVARDGDDISLLFDGVRWQLMLHDPRADAMQGEGEGGGLVAPMPGSVIAIRVAVGDQVQRGDPLVVVEAMKMEHTITAPRDGLIEAIYFAIGDQVQESDEILSLE